MDCFVVISNYASYCKRNDSQLANNLTDMSANDAGKFELWTSSKKSCRF